MHKRNRGGSMLKYLVGYFDQDSGTFSRPYAVVHARNREIAARKYCTRFQFVPGAGRTMALMTIFGPMNLDPMCTRALAARALEDVED